MSKFKVKLKITGFELEVEGERNDVQFITDQLGGQLNNMVTPIGHLAESNSSQIDPISSVTNPVVTENVIKTVTKNKKTSSSSGSNNGSNKKRDRTPAVEFQLNVDPQKWTIPTQEWSTLEKALWVLYMIKKELNIKEARTKDIAATFNRHFRQSGSIRGTNIARDFGNNKTGKTALVGENTVEFPYKWYLTESGEKTVMSKMQSSK